MDALVRPASPDGRTDGRTDEGVHPTAGFEFAWCLRSPWELSRLLPTDINFGHRKQTAAAFSGRPRDESLPCYRRIPRSPVRLRQVPTFNVTHDIMPSVTNSLAGATSDQKSSPSMDCLSQFDPMTHSADRSLRQRQIESFRGQRIKL